MKNSYYDVELQLGDILVPFDVLYEEVSEEWGQLRGKVDKPIWKRMKQRLGNNDALSVKFPNKHTKPISYQYGEQISETMSDSVDKVEVGFVIVY